MKGDVIPLAGQVLVRLMPYEFWNPAGLIIPDIATIDERGERVRPRKALVIAIGAWRKTKQGFAILPDFQVGQRVLVSEYLGTKLRRGFSEHLRLCRIDDVLAVLEETLEAPKVVDAPPAPVRQVA